MPPYRLCAATSLGCRLLAAEPLFAPPPADSIEAVQGALVDFTMEAEGSPRALMTLAMLYALNGQLTEARTAAEIVQTRAEDDPWSQAQSAAFLEALSVNSNTALDLCEALVRASEDPACNMRDVLGRYLAQTPLATDGDLIGQLEEQGFRVEETGMLTAIGRTARTLIRFSPANSGWWAFVARQDGTYGVERAATIETAPGGAQIVETVALPPAALTALLIDNDPRAALNSIESAIQSAGDTPLSPALRYIRALCYELIGDRTRAARGYYALWQDAPATLWGQLAAAHLERRG